MAPKTDQTISRRRTRGGLKSNLEKTTANKESTLEEELPTILDDTEDYTAVNVLLLTFKYTDLTIKHETAKVEEAFGTRLKYNVEKYPIEMKDSQALLLEKLSEFLPAEGDTQDCQNLYIIYYNGHGDVGMVGNRKTLALTSHAWASDIDTLWDIVVDKWGEDHFETLRESGLEEKLTPFRRSEDVDWQAISPIIMKAPCDTLVILDCCNAGLAAATSQRGDGLDDYGDAGEYRKELIGACGWGTETGYNMSPALSDVIEHGFPSKDSSMSVHTLVRRMNNRMIDAELDLTLDREPPQAVHYILQRNALDKMILPRFESLPSRN